MAMKEHPHPLNVVAAADRPLFPADRDVEDHVFCVIEFPAAGLRRQGSVCEPEEDLRAVFLDQRQRFRRLRRDRLRHQGDADPGEGAGGDADSAANRRAASKLSGSKARRPDDGHPGQRCPARASTIKVSGGGADDGYPGQRPGHSNGISRGYAEELEHWAWCIRNPDPENQPRCHPKVALGDAVIALTTNMAAREGRRIEFQEEWFDPSRRAGNARGHQARSHALQRT